MYQSSILYGMCSQDTYLQSSSTSWRKVPFPVEKVVGRDEIKFISNCPLPIHSTIQLFLSCFKSCNSCNFILSFTFPNKELLKVEEKTLGLGKLSIRKCQSQAPPVFSALLCSFNSQEKFVQGRMRARPGPGASRTLSISSQEMWISASYTENDPSLITFHHRSFQIAALRLLHRWQQRRAPGGWSHGD